MSGDFFPTPTIMRPRGNGSFFSLAAAPPLPAGHRSPIDSSPQEATPQADNIEHFIMKTRTVVCADITTVNPPTQILPVNKNRVGVFICLPNPTGFVAISEDPANFFGPNAHFFEWPGNQILPLEPPMAPQNAIWAMGTGATPVSVLEIIRVFGDDFLQAQR